MPPDLCGPREQSLLEVGIIFVEPSGFYLEGAGEGLVGVHRSGELGHSVTLERDVSDRLAEQRITTCIKCLNRHIDVLLIGCQEQETQRG